MREHGQEECMLTGL